MGAETVPAATSQLFGRFRELGWLHQAVREARSGRVSSLVVAGEAGIGKTAVFEALASELDVPVVRVGGADTGEATAYSGLAQLIEGLRPHLSAVPTEETEVLAAAVGCAQPVPVERFSVGAALGSLLRVAAVVGRGLVVIVDDASSVDADSLEALIFAARGMDVAGVLTIFGLPTPGPIPPGLEDIERMVLGGLDRHAAGQLLDRHAAAPAAPAVIAQLTLEAGGNPLALSELARWLTADQLAGRQPLPRPLPVGGRLRDAFAARIEALGPRARLTLLVVAASFGRLEVLADGLTHLGLGPTDLDQAIESGLVYVHERSVEFRHPLVRSVVYEAADQDERRRAHAALADANHRQRDLARRAWHLARAAAAPDEHAAATVAEAAEQAAARSGTVEAAAGYEAAARLSPDPERRAWRQLRAGQLWFMAGRVDAARAVAEEILAGIGPDIEVSEQAAGSGSLRAQAALLRGRALLVGSSEADGRRYLAEEADRASPTDPAIASSMLLAASASALRAGDVGQALRLATAARDRAVEADEGTRAQAEVSWLTARVASGDLGCRRVLTDAALTLVAAGIRSETPLVTINAGLALIWAGDHDGARRLIDKQEQLARTAPAPGALPAILTTRALLEHRTCRWRVAEVVATEALHLAGQTGQRAMAPYAEAVLATVEAILGRAEQCRVRCMSLLEGPARDLTVLRAAALSALGLLELGEGRPAEAARWFEVLAGSGASQASINPGIVMWGADLAEAYIRSGHHEKAAVVVGQLEELTSGTGDARVAAGAKRCRAMLAADDADAEALFAEALRHYGGAEWAFARARTELARGERLVRSGQVADGRERLERAHVMFSELGAGGWTMQAERQLAGLVPGTAIGQLTALELRVAGAAAFGGTSADIAAGLFLSEATVDAHLRSAMTKLGVSSAAELAGLPGLLAALGASVPAGSAEAPGTPEAARPTAGVRIRLLGTFEITLEEDPSDPPAGVVGQAVKRVALAGRVPIEELVEELWPDAPPGAGRTRFRALLTRLRRGAGSLLVRDGDWVCIAPGVEVDVARFEEAAAAAQAAWSASDARADAMIRHALDLYGGELLPTDRHLSFTTGPRERLRRRYLAVLGLAVEEAAGRSDVETAVRLLESAIVSDPHEEGLYLKAVSILVATGRRSEAASVLRRARAMLADLGLPLSPEGRDLERSLRTVD